MATIPTVISSTPIQIVLRRKYLAGRIMYCKLTRLRLVRKQPIPFLEDPRPVFTDQSLDLTSSRRQESFRAASNECPVKPRGPNPRLHPCHGPVQSSPTRPPPSPLSDPVQRMLVACCSSQGFLLQSPRFISVVSVIITLDFLLQFLHLPRLPLPLRLTHL